ncbi:hypothetical protein QZH41_016451 [Actinostola sp. cb2023]|nr:hypothetical protein QZH41_016451 [Actinostola sp. cb2023]
MRSLDFQYIFKHPFEFVVRAYFQKYTCGKDKNVTSVTVIEHRLAESTKPGSGRGSDHRIHQIIGSDHRIGSSDLTIGSDHRIGPSDRTIGSDHRIGPSDRTIGSDHRIGPSDRTIGSDHRIGPSDRTIGSDHRIGPSDRTIGSDHRIGPSDRIGFKDWGRILSKKGQVCQYSSSCFSEVLFFFPSAALEVEEEAWLKRKERILRLHSYNITGSSYVKLEEYSSYSQSNANERWTIMEQRGVITADGLGPVLGRMLEAFCIHFFQHGADKGFNIMEDLIMTMHY